MISVFFALSAAFSAKKIAPVTLSPACVLAVSGNASVPWFENNSNSERTEGILTAKINSKINKDDYERITSVERLDRACESVFSALGKNGFQFFEKDAVLNSAAYKNCGEGSAKYLSTENCASGFKKFFDLDKKTAKKFMAAYKAKSAWFFDFEFRKVRKNNRAVAGLVIMKVRVVDENGKEVLARRYSQESGTALPLSGNAYDKKELSELLSATVDEVLERFLRERFE